VYDSSPDAAPTPGPERGVRLRTVRLRQGGKHRVAQGVVDRRIAVEAGDGDAAHRVEPLPLVRMRLQVGPIGTETPQAQLLQAVGEARFDLAPHLAVAVPPLAETGEGPLEKGSVRIVGHGPSGTAKKGRSAPRR